MKPIAEEPSELEPPMTRALFDTDLDEAKQTHAIDPHQTIDVETHPIPLGTDSALSRAAQGSEPRPGSVGAWTGSGIKTEQGTGTGNGGSGGTGGTSRRGVFGKIEPDQTLYSKYRVLKKLGSGAMGDVWLVRHVTLESEHALKVIVPNFARSPVALMRFQREFKVMATLRHEHAVTIYDAIIDEDGGYIDMEYVDGKTLHDILNAARHRPDHDPSEPLMPLTWIVRVLKQLCDVLERAHKKGIVHRDLKPANMMLLNGREPGEEYLKVLDFGIAKIRDDPDGASGRELEESANKTEGFIGTPSYGSPEQAMAQDDVDGRADLYSVGIMLYEFITGRLPFRGNPLQVMSQNASAPRPPFAETNPNLRPIPEVERVVLKILARNRDERPQTARELFNEFRAAVEADLPHGTLGVSSLSPLSAEGWSGDSHPSSVSATIMPTEHEGQISRGMISTIEQTVVSEPSRHAIEKPNRIESPSDIGPAILDRPKKSKRWIYLTTALAACAFLAIGLVFWSTRKSSGSPEFSKTDSIEPTKTSSTVTSTKSTVEPSKSADVDLANSASKAPWPAKPFEDYWTADYRPVKGYQDFLPWPQKVRRVSDTATFVRFAPGVYLPEGYEPEDKTDLAVDGWPKVILHSGKFRFIRIPCQSEWRMGAWFADKTANREDVPAHPVMLTGFYIQETEVTNEQMELFVAKNSSDRPENWSGTFSDLISKFGQETARKHPAANISLDLALSFARDIGADIPTEAQWEYAARSGGLETKRYVSGDAVEPTSKLANIDRQDEYTTSPVGSYDSDKTDQGVFDMTGNVQEMCRDIYAPYKNSKIAVSNPCEDHFEPGKEKYVLRGASWYQTNSKCLTTRREDTLSSKSQCLPHVGFRLVVECPDTRKPRSR